MAVIILKNVKRVESYIIFTLHAGNVRLRCQEIVKTRQKRVNSVNHAFIERAVGVVVQASTFLHFVLETDISSIRCKDDVYYTFGDFRNNCQWFRSYSMIH